MHARKFRKARIPHWGWLLLLGGLVVATPAEAKKGDFHTGFFIGNTRYFVGADSTTGATFGLQFTWEVIQDLELRLVGAYAATGGTHTEAGTDYPLNVESTIGRLGTQYLFNRGPRTVVSFFAGGGLALMDYTLDHTYPGSTVNQVSGVAPGGYLNMGAEIKLTQDMTLLPTYEYQVIQLKSGVDGLMLYSTGFLLTLRLSS